MGFTVAIVGRPNVGKSTLFNRLLGEKKAIIDDISGVTRDRIYGECHWGGKTFNVIDTGGFVPNSRDIFESAIRDQVKIAIEEASLILFVVDVTTGITDLDDQVTRLLRKSPKQVLLVVNKVDNSQRLFEANEFYSLGMEGLYPISSINGSGTGDLLDAVVEHIDEEDEAPVEEIPKIAIIGQPNVGKSSLVNAFLGEDRNVVTDIAGTTRDSIHSHYSKFGKELLLIDTAGIRRKSKVFENLEFYSVIRAIKAIDEADVCLLLIDATKDITQQDLHLFQQVLRKRKGIIFVVNKWDLIEKDTDTAKTFTERILKKTAPFVDMDVVFVSVHEKQRIYKLLESALEVEDRRKQKISTSKLNEVMLKEIEANHPPAYKGKLIQIKYVTQLPTYYPSFAFFCNYPDYIRAPYKNYLENKLRKHFDLKGVPINVFFRKK